MYFAIEGVIGVGKTTLARLLQPTFDAEILLEVFEENPFLSNFYSDRERYAFQTQIFFLMSRYHQQNKVIPSALAAGKTVISDYTKLIPSHLRHVILLFPTTPLFKTPSSPALTSPEMNCRFIKKCIQPLQRKFPVRIWLFTLGRVWKP